MNFEEKNVLIYGLGISGKGVFDFLKNKGCKIYALDDNAETLDSFCRIYGASQYEPKNEYDYIITSPTVRRDSAFFADILVKNTIVMSEVELAAKFCKGKIIGVTGTNGKTTVVSLIAHILNKCGYTAYKCGNIGVPFITVAEKMKDSDYAVLELSSYQLLNSEILALDYAVLINVHQDHLDYHKSLAEYVNAKEKILSYSDNTIVNSDDEYIAEHIRGKYVVSTNSTVHSGVYVKDGMIYMSNYENGETVPLFETKDIGNMQGVFLQNCLLAICVTKLIGAQNIKILEAIESYTFEHYRLSVSGVMNGLTFYNDSKATNIHATLGAIKTIRGNYALILGGKDKGVPYDELMKNLDDRAKYILICGENAAIIKEACINSSYYNFYCFDNLEDVVSYAICLKGIKNVLFSPSAASFDKYSGYDERGAHYDKIVSSLKQKQ